WRLLPTRTYVRMALLRRQRASERDAAGYPAGELVALCNLARGEPEPPGHRPPAHDHDLGRRRAHEHLRVGRIDPDHEAALAARGHRHVAADEEREPAEHLLLGHAGLVSDQAPDPLRQRLVVRHRVSVASGTGRE